MQSRSLTLLILCLLAGLSAAAQDAATFENKDLDIRFKYPVTLSPAEPQNKSISAQLISKADASGHHDVIMLAVVPDPDIAKPGYLKEVGDTVAQGMKANGGKSVSSSEVTFAGVPAVQIAIDVPAGDTVAKLQMVLFVKGKRLYNIQVIAMADRAEFVAATFKQIADSIEFPSEKPKADARQPADKKSTAAHIPFHSREVGQAWNLAPGR